MLLACQGQNVLHLGKCSNICAISVYSCIDLLYGVAQLPSGIDQRELEYKNQVSLFAKPQCWSHGSQ